MKTYRTLIAALAVFLFSTLTIAEIRSTPYRDMTTGGDRVRTVIYKGDRIPFVELPVVEISDNSITPIILPATVVRGEFIPVAELPVVDIIAGDPGYSTLPVVKSNGMQMAAVILPMVNISANMPLDKLVAIRMVAGEPTLTATLEPVDICEDRVIFGSDQSGVLANWSTASQSNPELIIGKGDQETYFLMSYQGSFSGNDNEEILIYRLIRSVKQTFIGELKGLTGIF
jgi:hypothetical protein